MKVRMPGERGGYAGVTGALAPALSVNATPNSSEQVCSWVAPRLGDCSRAGGRPGKLLRFCVRAGNPIYRLDLAATDPAGEKEGRGDRGARRLSGRTHR